jgi:hypothetical protein
MFTQKQISDFIISNPAQVNQAGGPANYVQAVLKGQVVPVNQAPVPSVVAPSPLKTTVFNDPGQVASPGVAISAANTILPVLSAPINHVQAAAIAPSGPGHTWLWVAGGAVLLLLLTSKKERK